jgi:hypothetical protein
MPLLEGERVDHILQLVAVTNVELGVQEQLAEPVTRKAGPLHQQLDSGRVRRIHLEPKQPKDRDRVRMPDPEVQRPDQRSDLLRERLHAKRLRLDANGGQVLDEIATGLVAVHLLRDVPLQVLRQPCGDAIRGHERTRTLQRGLHQRDHRERDVRAGRQVRGVELTCSSTLHEQPARRLERRKNQV